MRVLSLSLLAVLGAVSWASDAAADSRRSPVPLRGPVRIDRRAVPYRGVVPSVATPGVAGRTNLVPQFQAAALRNTRGIDPNAAIAAAGSWGGSAGTYARNATPVRQARQGTQARQYVQPRIVRAPVSVGMPLRRPR
jgi:hypothetical protein